MNSLFIALETGNVDSALSLIASCNNPDTILNIQLETPLSKLCSVCSQIIPHRHKIDKCYQLMEQLLKKGSNPNYQKTLNARTPTCLLIQQTITHLGKSGVRFIELIISHGGDIQAYPELLNCAINSSFPCIEIIYVLLKAGLSANSKDVKLTQTPLECLQNKRKSRYGLHPQNAKKCNEIEYLLINGWKKYDQRISTKPHERTQQELEQTQKRESEQQHEQQECQRQKYEQQQREQQERQRQELERQELKRQELKRQELERQELERRELKRQELERQELERQKHERQEYERQKHEQQELKQREREQQECEQKERQQQELKQQEKQHEQIEHERRKREQLERERIEHEQQERERLEHEQQKLIQQLEEITHKQNTDIEILRNKIYEKDYAITDLENSLQNEILIKSQLCEYLTAMKKEICRLSGVISTLQYKLDDTISSTDKLPEG